jgi:TonB family protein
MQTGILAAAALAVALSTDTAISAQSTQAVGQAGAQSATENAAPATPDAVVQVDPAKMETLKLSKVAPVYPLEAKNAAIEGDVVMYAIVDEKGKVKSLDVLSGTEMLRVPALTAVNQWTYTPFTVNDLPVKVGTIITVHFRLSGNEPTS